MALDGLQSLLKERFKTYRKNYKKIPPKIHLARYADDFIITGKDKSVLENEVLPLVREFLSERGPYALGGKDENHAYRRGV